VTQTPVAMPTRIAVFPSSTPPPALKTSDGRTLPAVVSEVPRIAPQELQSLLASARNVVIIDLRDRESYSAGHIPGAIHMLYSEVETRYRQLPRTAKIVLYCA
jgi:hypothetical protein